MTMIEIPVDETLQANAQQVLEKQGFTIPEAVDLFLRSVVHDGVIPAVYRAPNATTLAALREAESGTLPRYTDADSFMRSLYEDD